MWTSIGQVLFLSSILVSSRNVKNPLPSFDFRERKPNEESLKDDGHKIGAFVIRNLGAVYKKSVDNFYLPVKKLPLSKIRKKLEKYVYVTYGIVPVNSVY